MFVLDVWVVDHFKSSVIRMLSFIGQIELMHRLARTSQTFDYVQAHFFVNQFEATKEVQCAVHFVFFCELLSVEVPSVS